MVDADPITRLNAALEGRYRVEAELGQGGMATVYRAEDVRHHRKVALKVLKPELAAAVGTDRFLAEIETTARLQHPHILPLFDSGAADGFLFYVMPHVEGESLRQRLDREHQLPVGEAVAISSKVAIALDYAHGHGVIHRDIKPANILLSETGEPLVADFGIALALDAGRESRRTETGTTLGTPDYMSPEQTTGDVEVGPATDVYAVACVLYEMLAGEPPYSGTTATAIIGKKLGHPAPSVRALRSSVSEDLDRALRRALAPSPADRYPTAAELTRALTGPTSIDPDGSRGGRRALIVGLAILTLLIGAVLVRTVMEVGGPRLGSASVAVLPFGVSAVEGDEARTFGEGIHSELLTQLQKLGTLEVIGHTSVFAFRDADLLPTEIADELGVASIVEGSFVMQPGGRFRLDVRLIDGANGRTLWAEAFRGAMVPSELLDTQAEIALAVADQLDVQLSPAERARVAERATVHEEAYRAYVAGEAFLRRWALGEAIGAFRRAVAADPRYGRAWARLAHATSQAEVLSVGSDSYRAEATAALERARALEPDATETHLAIALFEMGIAGDFDRADRSLSRALSLRPGSVEPLYWLTVHRTQLLTLEEAQSYAERALRRDPFDPRVVWQLGLIDAAQWNFSEALRHFDDAATLDPDNQVVAAHRFLLHLWGLGDTLQARRIVEDEASAPGAWLSEKAWLAYVRRDIDALTSVVDRLEGASAERYGWLARLHRLRGEHGMQRLYGDSMRRAAAEDVRTAERLGRSGVRLEHLRGRLATAQALSGHSAEAKRTIREAVERVRLEPDRWNRESTFLEELRTYSFLGDSRTALERLDELYSRHRPWTWPPLRVRMDPDFDALRAEPGLDSLLSRHGQRVRR